MKTLNALFLKVFPLEPVPSGPSLSFKTKGEGAIVTAPLLGKRWDQVDAKLCYEANDALPWFRPDTFVYYAPAYMEASLVDVNRDEATIFMPHLVRMWHQAQDSVVMQNMDRRVTLMSIDQLRAFDAWLTALQDLQPTCLLDDEISVARQSVEMHIRAVSHK